MTYTPIKTIIQSGMTLTENTDLTLPLSTFFGKTAYLVVQNALGIQYPISLSQIMLFTQGINLATPVGTVLSGLLTDAFVTQYNNSNIPIAMPDGYYPKRLRVFNPISYQEYQVDFTSINTPAILDDTSLRGSLDDLVISSTEDLSNSLVAVNGVFHKTVLFEEKLYVLDGFRNIRICGRKDITIVDTSNLGGHTVLPLTSGIVSQASYNGKAVVTTPTSIAGKTICIVIDGYWYHLDGLVFDVLDPDSVEINTNLLPLIQQFRHNPRTMYQPDRFGVNAIQASMKYTDIYDAAFVNENHIPTAELSTLDFQLSRLTAYHSFLVIFNNPGIFTVEREIFSQGVQRFYYDYTNLPLSGMMRYGCGLCPSYLIHHETAHRKQIFISAPDEKVDYFDQSYQPQFLPVSTLDPVKTSDVYANFIDYVSS